MIFALIFSIVESQLILPSHLVHRREAVSQGQKFARLRAFQKSLVNGLETLANNGYRSFLQRVIGWRVATTAFCVGLLIIALSMVISNRVVFGFFPAVEGDLVYAGLEMPEGTPAETTLAAARKIEEASQWLLPATLT